jgi:hypothetical protein
LMVTRRDAIELSDGRVHSVNIVFMNAGGCCKGVLIQD